VPREIEIDGEDASLIFYPNGRGEDFKVFLKNKNDDMKLIEIKKETGRANAVDYEEEEQE